jgi:hypothetical protein
LEFEDEALSAPLGIAGSGEEVVRTEVEVVEVVTHDLLAAMPNCP